MRARMAVIFVGGIGKDAIIAAIINRHHSQQCHHWRRWLNPTTAAVHQKLHHVPYYIDILLNCLGMFNLRIISTFFTLRSYFINLE
jgi:hypothetical protein